MKIPELDTAEAILSKISQINIILGRNGAGKSRFLRSIDNELSQNPSYNVRYISPERAGVFRRDGHIQNNMEQNKEWLRSVRGRNQADNFKAASANLLRELELVYLRRLESTPELRSDHEKTFRHDRLDKINRLLANISIAQEGSDLVFRSSSGEIVQADQISSGESEAIALASEIMYFFDTVQSKLFNILLLDEPDVHLHPDLQARLARLIISSIASLDSENQDNVAVCIATHSTPLVCALATSSYTTIGTKQYGKNFVVQISAAESLKRAAPFFGHPLSLSLSNDTLLIVEGEDDERVWQQAARSSQGRIHLFPVVAESVDQQTELERTCAPLLSALYDNPKAFSLRDGDGVADDLTSMGPVVRFRLKSYAIENLLVTDECLLTLGTSWPDFQQAAKKWLLENPSHRDKDLLSALISSDDRLRHKKIKAIRQLICVIAGTSKPWEVAVGQAIGSLTVAPLTAGATSLVDFIGLPACLAMNLISS